MSRSSSWIRLLGLAFSISTAAPVAVAQAGLPGMPTPVFAKDRVTYAAEAGAIEVVVSKVEKEHRLVAQLAGAAEPAFTVDYHFDEATDRNAVALTLANLETCTYTLQDKQATLLDCPLRAEDIRTFKRSPAFKASGGLMMNLNMFRQWEGTEHTELARRVITGLLNSITMTDEFLLQALEARESSPAPSVSQTPASQDESASREG